ncbi:MAG: chemotaxis protein CheW [Deltaproteobacteria bacterium]
MKSTTADAQKAKKIKKFVTLGLGNERYGIEVTKTREIIARYEIVPLPKTPEFIEGIISLRGDIIPVVDLRKRFELPSRERDADTRIIVIEMRDFSVGIQVDRVYEVLKLAEEAIEPPPPMVSGLKADYLEGVAEVQGKLTTILNLDEIFSSTERIILGDVEEQGSEVGANLVFAPQTEAITRIAPTIVSDTGMVEYGGKSYYVGKKHKGASVELSESGGRLTASVGGERIKEFEI